VNRSDRQAWQSARTFADLGELTAQWIEGKVGEQPGYCGPSDLDDPERLVPLLAALNRSGYMTIQSQAAFDALACDGAHWQQRAAVMGFAAQEAARLLYNSAWEADLIVIAHDPADLPRWFTRHRAAADVTRRGNRTMTGFGSHLSRRLLRGEYGDCHPDAVNALCSAWQVTVIDPVWGRPDLLWEVLGPAVAGRLA
jgi:hypothetical protein